MKTSFHLNYDSQGQDSHRFTILRSQKFDLLSQNYNKQKY